MNTQIQTIGKTQGNKEIKKIIMTNSKGLEVQILNYGGIIQAINIPTKNGMRNIVLGFEDIQEYFSEEYKSNCPYFGAIIGRYANRIAKGKFTIEGKESTLACNNAGNHLHGGLIGFDKQIWEIETNNNNSLILKYTSIDGEEGFPGNVNVEVHYTLTYNNELITEYFAKTDKATPINLTNHTYFNLSGDKKILDHKLQLSTNQLLESDNDLVPTGKIIKADTATDFTTAKTVGKDITEEAYDHTFVNTKPQETFAKLSSPTGDISMELTTNQPSVQLYSGKWIDTKYHKGYSGIALEPQAFPDAPNRNEFPDCILKPEERYYHKTKYHFRF